MSYLNLCNYCHKWIPKGYVIEWNHGNYHPNCAIQVAVTDTERKDSTAMDKQCDYCKQNVVAGCYEVWKGRTYHAICMAYAIQEFYEPPKEELKAARLDDQFVDENDLEPDYENEFPQDGDWGEDDDNPEGVEFENETRPDDLPDFAEPLPEFTNGHAEPISPEVLPPVAPMVHVGEVARNVVQAAVTNGSLMLGTKGSRYVPRSELFDLPTPPATSTWQPVAHADFVRRLLDGLWDRRMSVLDEKYAVSADGFNLYGLITLYDGYGGVNYAVGLRNSNNKSMRLSLAVGYVVKVCTNGMLHGEFQPLAAKHTAKFDLEDSLALGIDRIKRNFLKVDGAIDRKRQFELSTDNAEELVYKAFMNFKLPISLINTVHKELFIAPSFDEFKPLNLWSLENAFTTAFKKLQPTSSFEATAKLAKFIDSRLN